MADQSTNQIPNTNTRMVMIATILVGVLGAAIVLFFLATRPTGQPTADSGAAVVQGDAYTGIEPVEPARELPDFTLTDQNNQAISLSSLRGKMALILFGYTHCPDVCPDTLLNYKQIKKALGDQADQVNFVFISVDGTRDTPNVIKDYLGRFDKSFIGMTGDEDTLKKIGVDYDLYFEKTANTDGSSDDYLVIHNSNTYLVNKEGQLVALYVYGITPDVIADDLRTRLDT